MGRIENLSAENRARYAREAVSVRTGQSNASIVLLCEHGGFRIPAPWGTLGIPESLTGTHYGYDLGSRNLTLKIAELLDATAIVSNYSRLFLDYNRKSHDPCCIRPDMGGFLFPTMSRSVMPSANFVSRSRDTLSRQPLQTGLKGRRLWERG